MIMDSWNKQTQAWLKFICYDRLRSFKTLGVFILSIMWHGLEAPYICSFSSAALCVAAGRSVSCFWWPFCSWMVDFYFLLLKLRSTIRPLFQSNRISILFYDILSCICAKISNDFVLTAFCMPDLKKCIHFYRFKILFF